MANIREADGFADYTEKGRESPIRMESNATVGKKITIVEWLTHGNI